MSGALEVPSVSSCAFCDYLAGRRPYTIVYRDPLVSLLVTREQRGVSHVLAMPVRHAPTVLDLTDPEAKAIGLLVRRAAAAIDAADARPGISVWQNNGIPADQTIPHYHCHIAGTNPGGGTERGKVRELDLYETEAIAARLKPLLTVLS